MATRLQGLRRHPLIDTLLSLRGNPRACVFTEPLWGIPYNLYAPYATLFMLRLGVVDEQIGLILSIGMVFQVLASFFGGIVTDKLGRRLTTIIFDCISWAIPCLIWAFAQNFYWFLIAAIFNSFWQITNNSWNCLMVEDCDPKYLVNIYTWCNIAGMLAVFFVPLSGILVEKFTLVPVMRWLYIASFLLMSSKFIILYIFSTETTQGKKRREETKGQSLLSMAAEYVDVFKMIFQSKQTLTALAVMVLLNISSMLTTNFFALYIVENLNVPEALVTAFPMIRAAVMLVFIFAFQGKINQMKYRPTMGMGVLLYICSQVLLVLSPPIGGAATIASLGGYVLMEAIAFSIVTPRKDSLLVLFIDPGQRARVLGLLYVFMIAFSTPFGWIGGWLSSINRFLPFALNICLYVLLLAMVLSSKTIKRQDGMIV